MKTQMRQFYFFEKLLPSSRGLKRKCYNKSSFQNFIYSWSQSIRNRNAKSSFFSTFGSRKSNHVPFGIDTIERNRSFPKSASCIQRNFKRNPHPIRLLKQSLFTNNDFFVTQSGFFCHNISWYAKFLNFITLDITQLYAFLQNKTQNLHFQKSRILTNYPTGFFLIGSSPFNVIKRGLIIYKSRANNFLFNKVKVTPFPTIKIAFQRQLAFTSSLKKFFNPFPPLNRRFFRLFNKTPEFHFMHQLFSKNGFLSIISSEAGRFIRPFTRRVFKMDMPVGGIFLWIKRSHLISAASAAKKSINHFVSLEFTYE